MLDLTNMSVPTQSNGNINFTDLSLSTLRKKREKEEAFQLKYVCEIKQSANSSLEKKHNLVIDKTYLLSNVKETFWTIGKSEINGVLKAFAIKSQDGLYGAGRIIAKVWKGETPSNKITSEAAYSILFECGLISDDTAICNFTLSEINTNLDNCNVFEIVSLVLPNVTVSPAEDEVTLSNNTEVIENNEKILVTAEQEIVA